MIPLMKKAFLKDKETREALADFILHADMLSMGEKCKEFEITFATKQQRKHAILFNSGGSANLALLQALKNLGRLQDKDTVGFSALTWSTNVMPILQLGMKAVAVDCDPNTLNVMSWDLEKKLWKGKLKALFITNVLGFTGNLERIREICKKNNILLLEDNCESLGTTLRDGKAGNFSLASTFSFFVAHHMSTIEGGMVCTDDSELAEMLTIVRANGWDRNLNAPQQKRLRSQHNIQSEFQAKYTFYDLGFNLRPTEITGFLGLFQLKFLDENIKKRQKNYLQIEKVISKNPDLILLERSHLKIISAFAMPILCKSPELKKKYVERFVAAGIEIRPMIAGNMQNQPFYKKYVKDSTRLAGADFIDSNGFYCGNYPELTSGDLQTISKCLEQKDSIKKEPWQLNRHGSVNRNLDLKVIKKS
jgi:CDP-6-deoxy-D-xylo-4-hexulose-3-dehydrase